MLIFADYFLFIKQLLFSHIHHPTDLVKTDYFTEISTNTKINNLSDLYNICQTHKDFRSISVEVSDYRQTDFRLAEVFGKQLRFPSGIRRQNSFLPRKTAGFKAFLLMEPVCFYNCINSSKSCFRRKASILSTPSDFRSISVKVFIITA